MSRKRKVIGSQSSLGNEPEELEQIDMDLKKEKPEEKFTAPSKSLDEIKEELVSGEPIKKRKKRRTKAELEGLDIEINPENIEVFFAGLAYGLKAITHKDIWGFVDDSEKNMVCKNLASYCQQRGGDFLKKYMPEIVLATTLGAYFMPRILILKKAPDSQPIFSSGDSVETK